ETHAGGRSRMNQTTIITELAERYPDAGISQISAEQPDMPSALDRAGANADVYLLDAGLVVAGAREAVWVPLAA
ncbi:hypothetical protein, partial [Thiohalocapsa marina]|uniref:hypothetical protein n=1 Tax=Thiohalocapsa marina TaxID=424902 RepID=UPI0036DF7ED1